MARPNTPRRGSRAREGVIIEWPLNGQFHDARDVILTSRTHVREMVDDDDDDEWLLVIYRYFTFFIPNIPLKMTVFNQKMTVFNR